ncbi:MAG: hypothetical protein IH957_13535 [Chloroflexi bacterium]|nr:hypothetical protein [Chloroflexota bacterium]
MRFLRRLFHKDSSHQQLRELYRSSEDGDDMPDVDPAVREMFEADQELTSQLSQLAASVQPIDAPPEREALLARVREKKSLPVEKGLPVFKQLLNTRTLVAAGAAVLLLGAAATVGASGGVSEIAGNVEDVLDALQITSGSSTVEVCHVPDENPGNAHTISVGEGALDEHLLHGDTEGVCSESESVGSTDSVGPSDNIEVCHAPSDSADNQHTISVAQSAVDEHLAHGDTEGGCEDESSPGAQDSTGPSAKFEVCHTSADNQHTLSVPQDAFDQHLAHGDDEGACVGAEQQNGRPEFPGQSNEDHGRPDVTTEGEEEEEDDDDEDDDDRP